MKLEKQLEKGAIELSEAAEKLSGYESLPGLTQFLQLSRAVKCLKNYLTVCEGGVGELDLDCGLGIIILLALGPQWLNIFPLSVSLM